MYSTDLLALNREPRGLIYLPKVTGFQEQSSHGWNESAVGLSNCSVLTAADSDEMLCGRQGAIYSEIWWLFSGVFSFCLPQITLEFQNTVLSKAIMH
jgi:hypothetical protein